MVIDTGDLCYLMKQKIFDFEVDGIRFNSVFELKQGYFIFPEHERVISCSRGLYAALPEVDIKDISDLILATSRSKANSPLPAIEETIGKEMYKKMQKEPSTRKNNGIIILSSRIPRARIPVISAQNGFRPKLEDITYLGEEIHFKLCDYTPNGRDFCIPLEVLDKI